MNINGHIHELEEDEKTRLKIAKDLYAVVPAQEVLPKFKAIEALEQYMRLTHRKLMRVLHIIPEAKELNGAKAPPTKIALRKKPALTEEETIQLASLEAVLGTELPSMGHVRDVYEQRNGNGKERNAELKEEILSIRKGIEKYTDILFRTINPPELNDPMKKLGRKRRRSSSLVPGTPRAKMAESKELDEFERQNQGVPFEEMKLDAEKAKKMIELGKEERRYHEKIALMNIALMNLERWLSDGPPIPTIPGDFISEIRQDLRELKEPEKVPTRKGPRVEDGSLSAKIGRAKANNKSQKAGIDALMNKIKKQLDTPGLKEIRILAKEIHFLKIFTELDPTLNLEIEVKNQQMAMLRQ